jgi:hypothetical protein
MLESRERKTSLFTGGKNRVCRKSQHRNSPKKTSPTEVFNKLKRHKAGTSSDIDPAAGQRNMDSDRLLEVEGPIIGFVAIDKHQRLFGKAMCLKAKEYAFGGRVEPRTARKV